MESSFLDSILFWNQFLCAFGIIKRLCKIGEKLIFTKIGECHLRIKRFSEPLDLISQRKVPPYIEYQSTYQRQSGIFL